jgi:hypothetical protein
MHIALAFIVASTFDCDFPHEVWSASFQVLGIVMFGQATLFSIFEKSLKE